MLVTSTPDEAIAIGRRRVDVEFETALAKGSANYFQPSTMFTLNSFDIGSNMDPTVIAKQRDGPSHGHRSDAVRTGRVEPSAPGDYPTGDIEL